MQRLEFIDAELPYNVYVPDDYSAQTALPLIVFLHGRGERGRDLTLARLWGVPKYLDQGNDIPAIVYAPQCPLTSENWVSQMAKVLAGIDTIQAQYSISKTHITGFSMGGHGTHYLAVKNPERFTAVAPCATFMYPTDDITDEVCVLKHKPIWIFHSEADFVPVAHSDNVVEKLRICDAQNLKYTRYEKPSHTETADLAFLDEAFYTWILK